MLKLLSPQIVVGLGKSTNYYTQLINKETNELVKRKKQLRSHYVANKILYDKSNKNSEKL